MSEIYLSKWEAYKRLRQYKRAMKQALHWHYEYQRVNLRQYQTWRTQSWSEAERLRRELDAVMSTR